MKSEIGSNLTNSRRKNMADGLRWTKLWRKLPQFSRDVLGTFSETWQKYGDISCFRGLWTSYLFVHPRDVEYVLQTNSKNFRKGRNFDVIRHSTGNGIFTSEGDFWLRQRRLMQPVFHRQKISIFAKIITDTTEEMLERWRLFAERKQSFDVVAEFMRLTLSIIGKSLFNRDLGGEASVVGDTFEVVREYTMRRTMLPVTIPLKFPLPLNRRFQRAMRKFDKMVYELINERRRSPEKYQDLLTMLMDAQDADTGEKMSDLQLRDEVSTLIGAGHETTTQALGWTFYFLGNHAEIEKKLRFEVEKILDGRTPTFDDLSNLEYALMCFKEAMRIYPPVWLINRTAVKTDEVGGYFVPAKTDILLLPYLTHRHPEFWTNAEEFIPERFSAENSENRPKFAYFPFGGGPRICLGNNFAMMEAQLIIAMILQNFKVKLVPEYKVEAEVSLTLRPKRGIMVSLEKV